MLVNAGIKTIKTQPALPPIIQISNSNATLVCTAWQDWYFYLYFASAPFWTKFRVTVTPLSLAPAARYQVALTSWVFPKRRNTTTAATTFPRRRRRRTSTSSATTSRSTTTKRVGVDKKIWRITVCGQSKNKISRRKVSPSLLAPKLASQMIFRHFRSSQGQIKCA